MCFTCFPSVNPHPSSRQGPCFPFHCRGGELQRAGDNLPVVPPPVRGGTLSDPSPSFLLTTILFLQLSDSSERRINQTIRTKDETEEAQCSSHYLGNNGTKENGLQACRAPCPVHSLGLGLIISNMPRGTGDKNTLLCEILLHKAAVLHRQHGK